MSVQDNFDKHLSAFEHLLDQDKIDGHAVKNFTKKLDSKTIDETITKLALQIQTHNVKNDEQGTKLFERLKLIQSNLSKIEDLTFVKSPSSFRIFSPTSPPSKIDPLKIQMLKDKIAQRLENLKMNQLYGLIDSKLGNQAKSECEADYETLKWTFSSFSEQRTEEFQQLCSKWEFIARFPKDQSHVVQKEYLHEFTHISIAQQALQYAASKISDGRLALFKKELENYSLQLNNFLLNQPKDTKLFLKKLSQLFVIQQRITLCLQKIKLCEMIANLQSPELQRTSKENYLALFPESESLTIAPGNLELRKIKVRMDEVTTMISYVKNILKEEARNDGRRKKLITTNFYIFKAQIYSLNIPNKEDFLKKCDKIELTVKADMIKMKALLAEAQQLAAKVKLELLAKSGTGIGISLTVKNNKPAQINAAANEALKPGDMRPLPPPPKPARKPKNIA